MRPKYIKQQVRQSNAMQEATTYNKNGDPMGPPKMTSNSVSNGTPCQRNSNRHEMQCSQESSPHICCLSWMVSLIDNDNDKMDDEEE